MLANTLPVESRQTDIHTQQSKTPVSVSHLQVIFGQVVALLCYFDPPINFRHFSFAYAVEIYEK